MRFHWLAVAGFAAVLSSGTEVQALPVGTSRALMKVKDVARTLCTSAPVHGTNGALTLTAGAKAQLQEVLAQMAALAVDDGAGNYLSTRYRRLLPLLQRDLAEDIESSGGARSPDACVSTVSQTLTERLLPAEPWLSSFGIDTAIRDAAMDEHPAPAPRHPVIKAFTHLQEGLFVSVQYPPPGNMTLRVNGKTVLINGKAAVGSLGGAQTTPDVTDCYLVGDFGDLNLHPGINSLVVKVGRVTLPAYELTLKDAQAIPPDGSRH
jgi:hypothetical protein